jgi:hypothetical protein
MYSYDRRTAGELDDNGLDEQPNDFAQATTVLNQELEVLSKNGWWSPPHNYVVNGAMMNLNGWVFTILPFRADKKAYRPAGDRFPEGIVIDPNWASDGKDGPWSGKMAEAFAKYAKTQPSVPDTVRRELADIERHFKVQIPDSVKAKLVGDSLKVAKRRWGVDRLRRRNILVPFDGSKPITLGSWD